MANFTAADVKRCRGKLTGAGMSPKNALAETDGDRGRSSCGSGGLRMPASVPSGLLTEGLWRPRRRADRAQLVRLTLLPRTRSSKRWPTVVAAAAAAASRRRRSRCEYKTFWR